MKNIFPILILLLGLGACNSEGDMSLTITKNDPQIEYLIHLKQVIDSTSLRISDFAEDFKFIPLETREECILYHAYTFWFKNLSMVSFNLIWMENS